MARNASHIQFSNDSINYSLQYFQKNNNEETTQPTTALTPAINHHQGDPISFFFIFHF